MYVYNEIFKEMSGGWDNRMALGCCSMQEPSSEIERIGELLFIAIVIAILVSMYGVW